MGDEVVFEADKPPTGSPSANAIKEEKSFDAPVPKPNTVRIPLGKTGHITFEPDSAVPIFAIVALMLLILIFLIVVIAALAFNSQAGWIEKAITGLISLMSTIVGAMVGGNVAARTRRK